MGENERVSSDSDTSAGAGMAGGAAAAAGGVCGFPGCVLPVAASGGGVGRKSRYCGQVVGSVR
ncbi:MAG: hypothetical protein ACRC0L_12235, partial [Angustibacter sp.]